MVGQARPTPRPSPPPPPPDPSLAPLWFGYGLTSVSYALVLIALPLHAIKGLGASPTEVGLLTSLEEVGYLAGALVVGPLVDRFGSRPTMVIGAIILAAAQCGLVAVAFFGLLALPQAMVAMVAVGVGSELLSTAMLCWLPALYGRRRLIEAGRKLYLVDMALGRIMVGAAGLLVDLVTAIGTVAASALVALAAIPLVMRRPTGGLRGAARQPMMGDLATGARAVMTEPVLRNMALYEFTNLFAHWMFWAILLLYTTRTGISATLIGLIIAVSSVGSIVGAKVAQLTTRRRPGQVLIMSALAEGAGLTLAALAVGPRWLVVLFMSAGLFVASLAESLVTVQTRAIRQLRTPPAIMGRVEGAVRVMSFLGAILGGVAAGLIAEVAGLRFTLALAAGTGLVAFVWFLPGSVREAIDVQS